MFVLISNPNQLIGPKMAVLSCKITFFLWVILLMKNTVVQKSPFDSNYLSQIIILSADLTSQ